MVRQTLENRVESVEQRVTALEQLPGRMDGLESQILQLRAEMRAEFSATRGETQAGDEETRRTLSEKIDDARRETRVLHEDAIGRIAIIGEGLAALSDKVGSLETTLSDHVDRVETLSEKIDRTDAKVDLILERLDQRKRKASRRPK